MNDAIVSRLVWDKLLDMGCEAETAVLELRALDVNDIQFSEEKYAQWNEIAIMVGEVRVHLDNIAELLYDKIFPVVDKQDEQRNS